MYRFIGEEGRVIIAENKKQGKTKKELILYAIVGILTIALNYGTFILLYQVFHVNYKIANIIALTASKTFGYVGNKNIVFQSHCATKKEFWLELLRFVLTRGFTGILDYLGLWFAVDVLDANPAVSKAIVQVVVIVINYLTGKFFVFNKKEKIEK